MRIRKVVNRPINYRKDGVQVGGGINASISGNVAEGGTSTASRVRSHNRVVQRNGRTISESHTQSQESDSEPKEVEG